MMMLFFLSFFVFAMQLEGCFCTLHGLNVRAGGKLSLITYENITCVIHSQGKRINYPYAELFTLIKCYNLINKERQLLRMLVKELRRSDYANVLRLTL